MAVRRARAEDAAAIAALYAQLVPGAPIVVSAQRIAALENSAHGVLFVAEHEGRLCGTALLALCDDVMFGDQPFAVVENIVVDEAKRGQGIGAALMREIERHCLERDCSKIMLLSSATRQCAHSFFQQQGFAADAKRAFVKYRRSFSAQPLAVEG